MRVAFRFLPLSFSEVGRIYRHPQNDFLALRHGHFRTIHFPRSMASTPSKPNLFVAAYPYANDVLDLPVSDLDAASRFYSRHFRMTEARRTSNPERVILKRDGVEIGFSQNGRDPNQEGAAIHVTDLSRARTELEALELKLSPDQQDERDGERYRAFFATAPDGLCYYFYQVVGEA